MIVIGPINADAARWLETEIARRFAQPVRHPVNGLAFRDFPDSCMPDWIESLKRV